MPQGAKGAGPPGAAPGWLPFCLTLPAGAAWDSPKAGKPEEGEEGRNAWA